MTNPLSRHLTASEIVGSWPIIPPVLLGGTPTIQPGTINNKATILSVRREPAAGYDLVGKQFDIYIDCEAVPVATTIGPFVGSGGNLSLAEVITEINAVVTGLALNDNGFLRLTSTTAGDTSYLRLATDDSYPDTLRELGLFPGVVSRAGELVQAGHPDPIRQISLPGQLSLTEGEPFSAAAINRALFQVAVNTDRSEGMLSRRRITTQQQISTTYTSPGGGVEGYQFAAGEFVYTGDPNEWAGASPTEYELAKYFAVLDGSDRELTKEMEEILNSLTVTFSTDSDVPDKVRVTTTGSPFSASDVSRNIYIKSSSLSVPAAVRNRLLKIVARKDANTVWIESLDSNGNFVAISAVGVPADRVEVHTVKCVVSEVRTSSVGSRVEGVNTSKVSTSLIERVEKSNRVVFTDAWGGFASLSFPVSVGDRVVWSGHTPTSPFSNNGTYRVSAIIDDLTMELVGWDGEPVYLNPTLTTTGTITVTTDGYFYEEPFVKFKAAPDGAIPDAGEAFKIIYLGCSTMRDALSNPAALTPDGVRYKQEADDTVQSAILAIIGPSATTIDAYLYGGYRRNLESIDERLSTEHYYYDTVGPDGEAGHSGRHRTIRPDVIDMFPYTAGPTVVVRAISGEAESAEKIRLYDGSNVVSLVVSADGTVTINSGSEHYSHILNYHSGDIWTDTGTAFYRVTSDADYGTALFSAISTGASSASRMYLTGTTLSAINMEAQDETNGKAVILIAGSAPVSDINPLQGNSQLLFSGYNAGPGVYDYFAFDMQEGYTNRTLRIGFNGDEGDTTFPSMTVWGDKGSMSIREDLPLGGISLLTGLPAYNYTDPIDGTFTTAVTHLNRATKDSTAFIARVTGNLDSAGKNAGFLAMYPVADGATNDDLTWKAFKLMTEAALIDRFAINKYGQGFFGYESGISTNTVMPGSGRPYSAFFNRNLIVGDLAELSAQPWLGTDVIGRNEITILSKSNTMAASIATGGAGDTELSIVLGALQVDTGSGENWYHTRANNSACRIQMQGAAASPRNMSFSVSDNTGVSARDAVTWVTQFQISEYDASSPRPGAYFPRGFGLATLTKATGDALANDTHIVYGQQSGQIVAASKLGRFQCLDSYRYIETGQFDPEATLDDNSTTGIGTTETAFVINSVTIQDNITQNTLRAGSIIKVRYSGFYDCAGTGAVITLAVRIGPSATALASRDLVALMQIPNSVTANQDVRLEGSCTIVVLGATAQYFYWSDSVYAPTAGGAGVALFSSIPITSNGFDTTDNLLVTPTIKFGTANLGNEFTLHTFDVEVY